MVRVVNALNIIIIIIIIIMQAHSSISRPTWFVSFFFAMCSCDYTNISHGELHPEAERHTKLLCIRNFRFFQGTRMLDNFKDDLFQPDSISITFGSQKNQELQEILTQERSTDLDLCPVRSAASIIKFIVRMPGASTGTSINSFRDNGGKTVLFSSAVVVSTLREAAATFGKDVLVFSPTDIGCHSICSDACAMALFIWLGLVLQLSCS